ncbi:winged helix-turn-helix domain-containing protein [Streptomyces ipomoeae]|uniref:winged helix-turn-helix domain-containing protein n=1 Tax=Streptomyces ipomoeae TaxID=103232 RepID=UPI00114708C9|nr:winged helix-turn-helix domain-containing protein [Streptomyces ipomoeae]TQE35456.1 winged helix-turn-helix domain-containing protein [Streptomyces ipomoeae]
MWERRPISARALRLLLEGDTEDRYAGRDDADSGYRLTMALAVACSQPGRAWTPADFHQALIYTPTRGGWWARRLRERKGAEYAERKLTAMLHKAARFVGGAGTVTGRQDAVERVGEVRRAVEALAWPARGGKAVDQKNLAARLRLCESAGGLDHFSAVRPLAEQMGCARSTAEASNARLVQQGWLVLLEAGTSREKPSRWRLTVPAHVSDLLARAIPGQALPPQAPRLATVPELHTTTHTTHAPPTPTAPHAQEAALVQGEGAGVDTVALASVMAHDACHHWAHGASGARILACLDATEGASVARIAQATSLHRTTVARRLSRLTTDGLVHEREGLFRLAPELAGTVRIQPDEALLKAAADKRGTTGLTARRRERHARERALFERYLADRAHDRAGPRPRPRLVPEGVLDPHTGELLDERWGGWDLSDPLHPTWHGSAPQAWRGPPATVCA